jgi:glycosyltransferase involved in cell wall biosynthesis
MVAINVSQLSPGRAEGVVTYMKQLIGGLQKVCADGQLIIIAQPGMDLGPINSKKVQVIDLPAASTPERIANKLMSISKLRITTPRTKKLQAILNQNNVDIIHYPFSTIPPSDFKLTTPIILSIMDVQHEFLPELFTKSQLANRRASFGPSAKRADYCISISDYTTQSVVKFFGMDVGKITTVPLAGDVSTSPKVPSGLPSEYMYLPAGNWAHKNHRRLFEALAQLKTEGFTGKVVLTGLRSADKIDLPALAAELGVADLVVDKGQVSFDEVAGIYSKAKMLVYPTLFEGFGIPALEAMSVGLPVACSSTTSLPEIVGDAAETFNPESVDEIAAAIQKVWSDDTYRATLIKQGHVQAAKFSWKQTAKQTYQVYKDVYEQIS